MKKWLWIIPISALVFILGFIIWAETPLGPMPEAVDALQSDSLVQVKQDGWISFEPVNRNADTGLIIYPGGRVDPRSYAPTARAIAEQGYQVVIATMPLNLAVFNPGRAADIIAEYPGISTWALAGHSLGGAMAANYIASNAQAVDALALWASYPAESDSLVETNLLALSLYATLDGLTSLYEIEDSQRLLPEDTQFTAIDGGNHGQFGWYGEQPGDNPATISREQQQLETITAMVTLLEQIQP